MTASFKLRAVPDNEEEWGPTTLPETFHDIPYAPYSKSDRLGKIADWSVDPNDPAANRFDGDRKYKRDAYQAYGSGYANIYSYVHEGEDASFSLVDNARNLLLKKANRTNDRRNARGGRGGRGGSIGGVANTRGYFKLGNTARGGYNGTGRGDYQNAGRGGFRGGRGGFGKGRWDRQVRLRDASIVVGSEWKMLEEIEFSRLSKLSFDQPTSETLSEHGALFAYDPAFDRVAPKLSKTVPHTDRSWSHITTSEDPVMAKLAKENKANVFATDAIVSLLMCSARTVYPWDLVITKKNDQIFFDHRESMPVGTCFSCFF